MARPLRVLHVISAADRGGAETWLLEVLRRVERAAVAMDLMVHRSRPGELDGAVAACGATIHVCPGHRNVFRQWAGLRRLRRRYRYDIVHSHVDYYGGVVALLSRLAGVPCRIVSSHCGEGSLGGRTSFARRVYCRVMRRFIASYATAGIGTTASAASALFGKDWRFDRRWRVLHACADLGPFHAAVDGAAVRAQLGLPSDSVVFGHVGRFTSVKNHAFLVPLARALTERERRAHFLLVGGGPLRKQVEQAVIDAGLAKRFVFLPPRDDVPRLMLGAMDAFLFPSHHEGLGLALVEAQAAGLPCFASSAVPDDAVVVPELVCKLSLAQGPDAWGGAITAFLRQRSRVGRAQALLRVERCFDIQRNVDELVAYYQAVCP